ncbi:IS21 family transposase [Tsukamurella spumae]
MMGSKVELFAQIRRDARVEGMSIRALARKHGVHRRTVRQALSSAEPPPRKTPERSSPRLDRFKAAIDEMLRSDLDAPRKQRHTATRIRERLAIEHDAVELSYSTVRDYVRVRRAQIEVEAGRRTEVFIAQDHAPGAEAEVDFGEVWVILGGVKTKCHMFVYRLSHSGKAIHRVYPTGGQEAFLEGHVEAFRELGGVPTRHIRYDNLTSAVVAVLQGGDRRRQENPRWTLFHSHYGFDPFYCQPGIAGAHEKGGVEGEVGWFRRNRLTPMPQVESLDELNEQIKAWEDSDEGRRIDGRLRTIGQDYEHDRAALAPLPVEDFDPGLILTPRVDRSAMITVRMVKYSVPAHLIGRRVRVSLQASQLLVYDGRTLVARHPRVAGRGTAKIDLDHYLEVLKFKPGALPGSTALAQARAAGVFTASHDAFWAAARRVNGDTDGTSELIDVLLLHRSLPAAAVIAGIDAALRVGAVSAEVVAVEARRAEARLLAHASVAADQTGGANAGRHLDRHAERREQRVVSLTQRRLADPAAVIAGLPPDRRPLPSVTAYDRLLPQHRRRTASDALPASLDPPPIESLDPPPIERPTRL